MMYTRLRSLAWIAAFGFACLAPSASQAQMKLGGVRTEIIPDPNVRHHFQVILESGSFVKEGDYFTVYDIPDLVIGTNLQPNNWAASFSNSGVDPLVPPLPGFDNPLIPNVTFRYFAPIDVITVPPSLPFIVIGDFSVQAIQEPVQTVFKFGSESSGHTKTYYEVFGVPEPATFLMMGAGLAAVGLAFRGRRRANAGT